MPDLTDEQIGDHHDRQHADWLNQIPEEHARKLRDGYIRDVRANPEALQQLAEILDQENPDD